MFVTPEGLNTMIHVTHNTLVTQCKCYRMTLVSVELTRHIYVGILLTLRPTSLTFLPFTPLPVSFAQVLTTLSSVVHLSVQYPMVKGLSHIPPLLLGTLFLSRSALLIKSLVSDPELKHTFSVLPTNCLNVSVVNVICFPQSFISCCTAG